MSRPDDRQAIGKPPVEDEQAWVGFVIEENDRRSGMRKYIYAVDDGYALCRQGGLGDGRKSRVRIDRLYTARYSVISRPAKTASSGSREEYEGFGEPC